MGENLIPVLQLGDENALEEASTYLQDQGYVSKITPFDALPESDRQDWMIPSNGGWLFYLDASEYDKAMPLLGSFFGCTEPPGE